VNSKKYQLYGLGNAILDILLQVSEEEFQELGYPRSSMHLVEATSQAELLARFSGRDKALCSGGSVANSVVTFAQLGGKAAYCGVVADDHFGLFYKKEFTQLGINFHSSPLKGGHTGTCAVLITPDSERTMRTHLGVTQNLSSDFLSEDIIRDSVWLFIEGYLMTTDQTREVAFAAAELALRHGTKIAFTLSDGWIASDYNADVRRMVEMSNLLFANEQESMAFSGTSNIEAALGAMKSYCDLVITRGSKGVLLSMAGEVTEVPAYPASLHDLTGAGDVFAGTFLLGLCREEGDKLNLAQSARGSCYMAARIIEQIGARFSQSQVDRYWSEFLKLK
jgi:sugar/nucleoside kinase (ribokinase family)